VKGNLSGACGIALPLLPASLAPPGPWPVVGKIPGEFVK
jgi:hypothetical protein